MDFRTWQRAAGPGLVFSGSAIGVSHLVQSTRAGAMFGLALILVIVAINVLKYPAFRFGMDYAHATRKTLIGGYRELGLWAVLVYVCFGLAIAPIGLGAVTATTAAILAALTGIDLSIGTLALLAVTATVLLLIIGGYGWMDRINKALIAFLSLATVCATVLVLPRVEWGTFVDVDWSIDPMSLLFVIALAGFMPSAMSQCVPLSIWTLKSQEDEEAAQHLTLRAMHQGFFSSYALTTFLAVCFCIMGAGVMHSSGIAPAAGAAEMASQIIGLYRETLGEIPATLAAIAALCVMATTMVTAFDGAARGLGAVHQEFQGNIGGRASTTGYIVFLLILAVLTVGFILLVMESFADFIDLVTSIYFVVAPALAFMNHLVVTRCEMPEGSRPSRTMRMLSLTGVVVMTLMAVLFFVLKAA